MKTLVLFALSLLCGTAAFGEFDLEAGRPRVQCVVTDNQGTNFTAVKRTVQNAEDAALTLCIDAGGINCKVTQCTEVQ